MSKEWKVSFFFSTLYFGPGVGTISSMQSLYKEKMIFSRRRQSSREREEKVGPCNWFTILPVESVIDFAKLQRNWNRKTAPWQLQEFCAGVPNCKTDTKRCNQIKKRLKEISLFPLSYNWRIKALTFKGLVSPLAYWPFLLS